MASIESFRKLWIDSNLDLLPTGFELHAGAVLDIGANIGDWTAAVLVLHPTASIVAFEPSPANVEALRARFDADSRVEVIASAVSDANGATIFHVTADDHLGSLLQPRDMNATYGVSDSWNETATVEVATVTLDSLLSRLGPPSLVKIDVQGAEAQVISGGHETLRAARAVLIEMTTRSHYVNDHLAEELHDRLGELGYRRVATSEPWLDAHGDPLWYDACYVNGGRSNG